MDLPTSTRYSAKNEDSTEKMLAFPERPVYSDSLLNVMAAFEKKIATLPASFLDIALREKPVVQRVSYDWVERIRYERRMLTPKLTKKPKEVRFVLDKGTSYRFSTTIADLVVRFSEDGNKIITVGIYLSKDRKTSMAIEDVGVGNVPQSSIEEIATYLANCVITDRVYSDKTSPLNTLEAKVKDARLRIPFSEVRNDGRYSLVLKFPQATTHDGERGNETEVIGDDIYRLGIAPILAWFMPNLKEKMRKISKAAVEEIQKERERKEKEEKAKKSTEAKQQP